MSMRPNTLTPNQGGEAMQSQKVTTKPRLRDVICPHRNDRHKKLKWCEIVLIVLLWLLLILQIVALQQSLDYAPYAPIGIVLIVAVVLFWFFAILEIILFSVLTHKIILDHQADGHGTEKQHWCRRYVLKRWSCCLLALAMIGSFIMLFIMLSFLFPEFFHPTGDLTIIRIGAVTPTAANFFIRYRHPQGPIYLEYRQVGESSFQRSEQSLNITGEKDFTGVIRLDGLTPATAYEWRFNVQDDVRQFKTNPAPGTASQFTFVFGSCFLYNFPYQLGATGFEHVASLKPDLVNMMGDFVYADVPIFRGKEVEDYVELYRQNFRSKGVIQTFSTIPNYFMWDDHEVYNDWDKTDRDEEAYNNGINIAWKSYVGDINPQMPYTRTSIYYFSYDYGDTSFFFLDTRSFRDKNDPPDGGPKTFLGLEQKQELKDWLIESSAVFKFIVSTVGITIDLRSVSDTWGEYSTERTEILNFIRDNSISGVIFLTADSHFAYVSELVQPGSGLYEWSVSPIDAFDFDLGGYSPYSDDPFVDIDDRKERVVFSDKGGRGSISFIGHVTVDTVANPPFVTLSILNRDREIFNMTLTVNQINTLASIKK